MPNISPRDGIFNPRLKTINDSYKCFAESLYDKTSSIGQRLWRLNVRGPKGRGQGLSYPALSLFFYILLSIFREKMDFFIK